MLQKIILSCLIFSVTAAPGHAQEVLRFANFIPPNAAYSPLFQSFADRVNADGEGVIRIDVYAGGTLGTNSTQQIKLLEDDVVQIAFVVPGLTAGRFPEISVAEQPLLVRSSIAGSRAMFELYQDGEIPSLDDFHVLAIVTTTPLGFHSVDPIRAPGDVRGKRIRVGSAINTAIVETLNGAPVQLGGAETPEALARGVIEGLIAEPLLITTFTMQETAKHHLKLPMGANTLMVAMRKDKYEALSSEARTILDRYGGEVFTRKWAKTLDAMNATSWEIIDATPDNSIEEVDADVRAQWKTALGAVTKKWVEQKPERNRYLLEKFKAELAEAGN